MRDNRAEIDWRSVTAVTALQHTPVWQTLLRARAYLTAQKWHPTIVDEFFGWAWEERVAVFLFRIHVPPESERKQPIDEFLWVVAGQLPSLYFVTDQCATPRAALQLYLKLAQQWLDDSDNTMPKDSGFVFTLEDGPRKSRNLRDKLHLIAARLRRETLPAYAVSAEILPDAIPRVIAAPPLPAWVELTPEYRDAAIRFAGEHQLELELQREAFPEGDLGMLQQHPEITRLELRGDGFDLSSVGALPRLQQLSIHGRSAGDGDFSSFPALQRVSLFTDGALRPQGRSLRSLWSWNTSRRKTLSCDLSGVPQLEELHAMTRRIDFVFPETMPNLHTFTWSPSGNHDLSELPEWPTLADLTLRDADIRTLTGIERFSGLRRLRLESLPGLNDISALARTRIEWLFIDHCPGIADLSVVAQLPLRGFGIDSTRKIPTIRFLESIESLEMAVIHAPVADGHPGFLNRIGYLCYPPNGTIKPSSERLSRNHFYQYRWGGVRYDNRQWYDIDWISGPAASRDAGTGK